MGLSDEGRLQKEKLSFIMQFGATIVEFIFACTKVELICLQNQGQMFHLQIISIRKVDLMSSKVIILVVLAIWLGHHTVECVCGRTYFDYCGHYQLSPRRRREFEQSYSRNTDIEVYGGRIVAYKIRWFSGRWSSWYIPGINDIDAKTTSGRIRRMWASFTDHTHQFILCRQRYRFTRSSGNPASDSSDKASNGSDASATNTTEAEETHAGQNALGASRAELQGKEAANEDFEDLSSSLDRYFGLIIAIFIASVGSLVLTLGLLVSTLRQKQRQSLKSGSSESSQQGMRKIKEEATFDDISKKEEQRA